MNAERAGRRNVKPQMDADERRKAGSAESGGRISVHRRSSAVPDPFFVAGSSSSAGVTTATSSVWLLAAWGVGAGASVVINLVARWVLKEEGHYGNFAFALATLVWVEYAVSATFPISYQKLASESVHNLPRIFHSVVRLCLPACLALLALYSLAALALGPMFRDPALTRYFLWAGPDIPFLGMYAVAIAVLNGTGRTGQMGAAAAGYACGRVTFITGTMVVLWALGAGPGTSISGSLLAKAFASAFGLVVALRFLRRIPHERSQGPHAPLTRHVLRYGAPLGATTVAVYLLINVDYWLVKGLLEQKSQTDYYMAARAVAFPLVFVGIAMRNAVFPTMAMNLHQGNREQALISLRTALRFVLVIGGLLCALLPATAVELMSWLFRYPEAGPPMVLLVLSTALFAAFSVYVSAYAAADRPLEPFFLLLGLAPLAVLAHVLIIPKYEIRGAATVTLAAVAVGVIASAVWLWRRLGARPPLMSLVRVGVAAAFVAVLSRRVPAEGFWLLPKYAVMALAYGAVLLAVREVRMGEVTRLLTAVRGALARS